MKRNNKNKMEEHKDPKQKEGTDHPLHGSTPGSQVNKKSPVKKWGIFASVAVVIGVVAYVLTGTQLFQGNISGPLDQAGPDEIMDQIYNGFGQKDLRLSYETLSQVQQDEYKSYYDSWVQVEDRLVNDIPNFDALEVELLNTIAENYKQGFAAHPDKILDLVHSDYELTIQNLMSLFDFAVTVYRDPNVVQANGVNVDAFFDRYNDQYFNNRNASLQLRTYFRSGFWDNEMVTFFDTYFDAMYNYVEALAFTTVSTDDSTTPNTAVINGVIPAAEQARIQQLFDDAIAIQPQGMGLNTPPFDIDLPMERDASQPSNIWYSPLIKTPTFPQTWLDDLVADMQASYDQAANDRTEQALRDLANHTREFVNDGSACHLMYNTVNDLNNMRPPEERMDVVLHDISIQENSGTNIRLEDTDTKAYFKLYGPVNGTAIPTTPEKEVYQYLADNNYVGEDIMIFASGDKNSQESQGLEAYEPTEKIEIQEAQKVINSINQADDIQTLKQYERAWGEVIVEGEYNSGEVLGDADYQVVNTYIQETKTQQFKKLIEGYPNLSESQLKDLLTLIDGTEEYSTLEEYKEILDSKAFGQDEVPGVYTTINDAIIDQQAEVKKIEAVKVQENYYEFEPANLYLQDYQSPTRVESSLPGSNGRTAYAQEMRSPDEENEDIPGEVVDDSGNTPVDNQETNDGGSAEGTTGEGSTEGGTNDGGSAEGTTGEGSTEGGTNDGGSTEGSTGGESTEGGMTEGGSNDGSTLEQANGGLVITGTNNPEATKVVATSADITFYCIDIQEQQVPQDGEDGTDGFSCWDTNQNGMNDDAEDVNQDGEWNTLDCQGADGADGTDGGDGQACWDTNSNGVPDPEEDVNNDGLIDVQDCQGADGQDGTDGFSCWDTNQNGMNDDAEDVNQDGFWSIQDCQGSDGEDGTDGFSCWDTNQNGMNDDAEDVNQDGFWSTQDCQGSDGEDGEDGVDGQDGADGQDGIDGQACWDVNNNGTRDTNEDTNGDGIVDINDCRGQDGRDGSGIGGGEIYIDINIEDNSVTEINTDRIVDDYFGGGAITNTATNETGDVNVNNYVEIISQDVPAGDLVAEITSPARNNTALDFFECLDPVTPVSFTDIANAYYAYEPVQTSARLGYENQAITIGYPQGVSRVFRDKSNITRAELNKMVAFASCIYPYFEQEGIYDELTNRFNDNSANDWFYRQVNASANGGLIQGYTDGTFKPNQPITRAEATKIIVEIYLRIFPEKQLGSCTNSPFKDVFPTEWYCGYAGTAFREGIVLGSINSQGDHLFRPNASITRGEVAVILYNFFITTLQNSLEDTSLSN